MSTSMMRGLQLRNLIRLRLQDVASNCREPSGSSFRIAFIWSISSSPVPPTRSVCMKAPAVVSPWRARPRPRLHRRVDVDVGDALLRKWNVNSGRRQTAAPRIEAIAASCANTLCRCLRSVEPAYQRSRGAAMVAAISDLRGRHDRPSVGHV